MPKFDVEITETVYTRYTVEAENETEARVEAVRSHATLRRPDSRHASTDVTHVERLPEEG